jgi:hypothetical protein
VGRGESHQADRGVKRREEFVFHKDPRVAERVEQGRFPGVGVSHEGQAGEVLAAFSLNAPFACDAPQAFREMTDPGADHPPVGFDLRLARAFGPDAAVLFGEMGPLTRQA